jgi:flagellar hook-associated protein 2
MTTTSTSTISTGTVTTSGSTTYVSGASSGIDTDALVKAGYEAKLAPADIIDTKITDNEAIIAAYQNLQSLGDDLNSALDSLKTIYGYSSTDTNVYSSREGYLAASDGSTVGNYISVEVDSSATQANYSISIQQIASTMKVSSETQTSKTDDLGLTGSFSVSLGDTTAMNINVTSDMSLGDIASNINATTDTTGIKATIVKSSSNSYSLMLSGSETGQNIIYSSTSGTDIFKELGLMDTSGNFSNVIQSAQNAIITVDGLEVTSSSNTISDALEGVSITLYNAPTSSDVTFTMEVDYDYTATKNAIQSFVDAYNNLQDFFNTQKSTNSDGTASDDAVLFSDTLLKTLSSSVSSILSNSYGNSSTISTLADLGITFDSDNKLKISDETTLNSALLNNYADVQALFQTSVTTDSSSLSILRNTSTQSNLDFNIDITVDSNGDMTSASVNGDTSAFTISGNRLKGAEGTIYEGLVFVFSGNSDTTVNVSFSQGLADRLSNLTDSYTNSTDGTIQSKIDRMDTQDNLLQIKSDRIKERAESYRTKLIEKYAAMESAISSANSLLKQVQALFGTSSSDG